MKKLVFAVLFLLFTLQVLAQDLPPGDKPAATVFSKVKEAGTKDDFPDADYVIVEDSSICRVNEKGIAYTDMYVVYKALTDGGCKQLAVQRWHYEPLSSFVEVKEVNVIRGDEKIPVDLGGLRDLPAPQSGIYWGDRILLLQLPRLEENDGIEIRAKRKGYSYALLDDDKYIPPMEGQYFDIVVFSAAVPIKSKKYVLKMPVNKRIHSRIYNGPMYSSISYGEDETTYGWWSEDVPAQADEYYGAEATDVYPKVVIATVESWEAKSKWFFDVNEGQFKFTDAIKAKVKEIFEQAGVTGGTEEEKAFALVHWVAQNIRYSGQTMGEGEGYTLHSGAMIFEQRSGVCKDIAGMLITMMRAAGMDSYGAMTMAGSRIEEEVPAD